MLSSDSITERNGFEKLDEAQQISVLNHQENFVGLCEAANRSKGAKTFEQWTEHKASRTKVSETFSEQMMTKGKE